MGLAPLARPLPYPGSVNAQGSGVISKTSRPAVRSHYRRGPVPDGRPGRGDVTSPELPEEADLMFDWAHANGKRRVRVRNAMLLDETLRDGLQCPSVNDPPDSAKVEILHLMNGLGIETANLGLPGSGPRQRGAVRRLAGEIADARLSIAGNCAARTVIADIEPIVDIVQETGVPIETCVFIGCSPIRQYAEAWDLDFVARRTEEAIRFAAKHGLEVMYVTEDTVRSRPEVLDVLFRAAVDAGARRLCLCDTAGAAEPLGVHNLVTWTRDLLRGMGVENEVGIDWHGHRDRGLDLANALAALEAGASRVHGTALGIGERVGNTPMEQLLVNLRLFGWRNDDLADLPAYVAAVSTALGVPIPPSTPVVGRDAFRTSTGVHAAAVVKAQRRGAEWLADRVYSGVPAGWLGRVQEIEVGHMSGVSNVRHYLTTHRLPTDSHVVQAVLGLAKRSARVLTREEIIGAVDVALGSVGAACDPPSTR
jgi:2-isopropylmalate synthase